jgi:hypothetical protein
VRRFHREGSQLLSRFELSSRSSCESARSREKLSELNAFISLLPKERSRKRGGSTDAPRGEVLGPLQDPITAKDSSGPKATRRPRIEDHADFVPDRDAPRSRASRPGGGAPGKTNLHELAYGVSNVNPHYGAARNPWDRTGSAAVERRLGGRARERRRLRSIGTDTGGSIGSPLALRHRGAQTTYGRISARGDPLSWSLDHVGPMAGRSTTWPFCTKRCRGAVEAGAGRGARPSGISSRSSPRHFFENLAPEVEASCEAPSRGSSLRFNGRARRAGDRAPGRLPEHHRLRRGFLLITRRTSAPARRTMARTRESS